VYDAGHILGSLQFRFEKFSSSIVYTGDLNLVDTLITRAGEIVECDELIIDATYGNPRIIFPDRWSVYEDLSGFVDSCVKVGKPPVFKAYTVGKAQEIIALINGFLGMEVLVDSRIARVNEVYRFAGVDLNYISLASDDGKDAFKSMSLPLVTSNHDVFRVASSMGMVKALATGWSILYSFPNYDASFPLSSHADFNQLVSYIERAKPSRVYPVGHYARDLSTWLRKNMSLYSIPLDDLA
ncbi:MAG: MBL fold metallo-hydrolase, partial [Candidatus Methanomethylicia archaeon]